VRSWSPPARAETSHRWRRRKTVFDRKATKRRQRKIGQKGGSLGLEASEALLSVPESRHDLELEDMHAGQLSESSGDELFLDDAGRARTAGAEALGRVQQSEHPQGGGVFFEPRGPDLIG